MIKIRLKIQHSHQDRNQDAASAVQRDNGTGDAVQEQVRERGYYVWDASGSTDPAGGDAAGEGGSSGAGEDSGRAEP